MEGFIGEHGGVIVSGVIAVFSIIAAVGIIYAAGQMEFLATVSVIGG